MAWHSPSPALENAIPAMQEASSMFSRAARSWPQPTAFGSASPIMAIAPIARLSVNGVAWRAL